ncbi:MAG: hypothetical protein ACRC8S_07975 [Fimbriiglobus sp.]
MGSSEMNVLPSLSELTQRFLAGEFSETPFSSDEVTPYEVVGGFMASASELWQEATIFLNVRTAMPPEWASFCQWESSLLLAPFGVGLYPQQNRDFAKLSSAIEAGAKPKLRMVEGFSSLKKWAKEASGPAALVASGLMGSLGDFALASHCLANAKGHVSEELFENQAGVIAWLQGDEATAVRCWKQSGHDLAQRNLALVKLLGTHKSQAFATFSDVSALRATSGWSYYSQLLAAFAE